MTLSDRIAVFNNGFIEQVGTPYEIYNHSGSEFVCDFIGDINRLNGQILGDINAQTGAALKTDRTGFIRIERLLSQGTPSMARLTCVVSDLEYSGMLAKYTVEIAGAEVRVVEKNDGRRFYEKGEQITVYVDPKDIMQY